MLTQRFTTASAVRTLIAASAMCAVACGAQSAASSHLDALPPGVDAQLRQEAALCDGGDRSACAQLAIRYFEGDGVGQDYPRATELFHEACDEEPPVDECSSFVTDAQAPPPLSPSQISSTTSQNRHLIDACFRGTVLGIDPDAEGRIIARFNVAGNGQVVDALLLETPFGASFTSCAVDRMRDFQFPAPRGGVTYRFEVPFDMAP